MEKNEIKIDKLNISDINKDLIHLYLSVKKKYKKLIVHLKELKANYEKAEVKEEIKVSRKKIEVLPTIEEAIKAGKEHVYYFYRNKFNELKKLNSDKKISLKSALFIFLNKTCFRGVYRENTSGAFNVPYGNNVNVSMFDKDNLKRISYLLNKYNVNFSVKNFYELKETIKYTKISFVYLDPPYYPENETSFTSYTAHNFNLEQHKNLIELCKHINTKKSKFLLSNSNTNFIKDNLKEFNIKIINLKRQINSKNPGATTNEVLIYN
jgi:DNA adenine methylase